MASHSGNSVERLHAVVQCQACFTEGIISHLSILCELFSFHGEQKVRAHSSEIVIQLSFGPLECVSLFTWSYFSQ